QRCLFLCSGVDQEIFVSQKSIGLNGGNGIRADNGKEFLHDTEFHAKLFARATWYAELQNLTGIESGNAHFASDFETTDAGVVCVEVSATGKQHPPVSNQEQAQGKKQESSKYKYSHCLRLCRCH